MTQKPSQVDLTKLPQSNMAGVLRHLELHKQGKRTASLPVKVFRGDMARVMIEGMKRDRAKMIARAIKGVQI